MTAPAIPLCLTPDAHPTTCPCPRRTGETYYGQPITTTRDISTYQEQHVSDDPRFFIRPPGGDFIQVTEEELLAAGPGRSAGSCTGGGEVSVPNNSGEDIEISDPHSVGEAHGCPEECPAHNPGGPDVDPATVAGAPTDLDPDCARRPNCDDCDGLPEINQQDWDAAEAAAANPSATTLRLAELAQLQPGWYDGVGEPMSRQTLATARRLAVALPPTVGKIYIYPMESGGIELEWRDHTGTHSIEINPDDTLFLLSDDPPTVPCDHRCNCGCDQADHSARYCGRCQDPCNSSGHYPEDCDRTIPDAASQPRTTPDNPAASGDAADNLASRARLGALCWPIERLNPANGQPWTDEEKRSLGITVEPNDAPTQLGGSAADANETGPAVGTTYFCPASGDVESPIHGGFDTCCDRPDLHELATVASPATLADLLTHTLAEQGISQADLARRTRLSTKHVNQICKGIARISIDAAVRLEFALGLPAAEWMRADAASQIADYRDAALLSMVTAELQQLREAAETELPDRAQAAIRALEQQVEVRDRQLAAVRALLAAPGNSRHILPGDLRAAVDGAATP